MKARYYRADIARFISPDPLGIAGGVNLYAYANGDPIRFLDPTGEFGLLGGGFGGSVVGIISAGAAIGSAIAP